MAAVPKWVLWYRSRIVGGFLPRGSSRFHDIPGSTPHLPYEVPRLIQIFLTFPYALVLMCAASAPSPFVGSSWIRFALFRYQVDELIDMDVRPLFTLAYDSPLCSPSLFVIALRLRLREKGKKGKNEEVRILLLSLSLASDSSSSGSHASGHSGQDGIVLGSDNPGDGPQRKKGWLQ